ncbi:MAG: hypothetical protein GXP41_07785 [Chloroflexi bacterium]|nr:hypothetical protein [Chloroflexota bacterium]
MTVSFFSLRNTSNYRRIRLACYIFTLFLLVLGIRGLWRLGPDIGQPFGGIPISWGRVGGFNVNVDVPWNWPGPQHGLRGGDKILRIDGQDPYSFMQRGFAGKALGEDVTFVVQRNDKQLRIPVPVDTFAFERFVEFYGFWFLAGITSLLSSSLLIRTATDEARIVLALAMLAAAAGFMGHGYSGYISHFHFAWDVPSSVIWHYTYPIMGVLLLHFALVFPRPLRWLENRPSLRLLLYLWASVIGTFYLLSNWFFGPTTNNLIFDLVLSTLSVGAVSVVVRPAWSFFRPGPEGRGWAVMLGTVWAVGVLLMLGVGVLPFVTHGTTMILTEVLLPLCMIYPLMLVYAAYNVDLIEKLQREVQIKNQFADEVNELRGIRERTLHELADELHDTIVPDSRGLQLWLQALRRRWQPKLDPEDAVTLVRMEQTLDKTYKDARRIMEGAKPVEFAREGLIRPLKRFIAQANRAGWWTTEIEFIADDGVDRVDPHVAEDIYWIVRTALNNCRDHAQAKQVSVRLQFREGALLVSVSDDGHGFSVEEVRKLDADTSRRHLGLRNIDMRAERIHADLKISSDSQGTTIRLLIPLEDFDHAVLDQNDHR